MNIKKYTENNKPLKILSYYNEHLFRDIFLIIYMCRIHYISGAKG